MRRTSAPGSIDNKYIDRNLDLGREGTLLLAENLNDFQEEIANTIEEAGITLDPGDRKQLSKAVVLAGGGKDQQVTGVKSFTEIIILPASNPTTGNQATRKTYVDTLDAANVKLTGNQSIGGTKTFSSSPVVPTPTSASHAARKDYVDGAVAGLEGDAVLLTGNQSIAGTKTFTSSPRVPITPAAWDEATSKGYVDGLDSANVKLTGNQSIAGTKTFASLPMIPTTPTQQGHAASKHYADQKAQLTDSLTQLSFTISAGSSYIPPRGLYLFQPGEISADFKYQISGVGTGFDGTYSLDNTRPFFFPGNTSVKILNNGSEAITIYLARVTTLL